MKIILLLAPILFLACVTEPRVHEVNCTTLHLKADSTGVYRDTLICTKSERR